MSEKDECEYCEYGRDLTVSSADNSLIGVEVYVEGVCSPDSGETLTTLLLDRYGDEARVYINYCPMCGRDLGEDA